jgi:hypothetical protein
MKKTDQVKVQWTAGETAEISGRVLRLNKKGDKVVIAVTVPVEDVVECTPRTYKRGIKSESYKSINTESRSE